MIKDFERLVEATKKECPDCGGYMFWWPYQKPHLNPVKYASDRTKPGAVVFGHWRCLDYYGCENG